MAEVYGPRALIDNVTPVGIDANYIYNFQMQENMTPQEVITLAATVIGETNEYLMNTYGGLIYLTEKEHARYRQGKGVSRKTPKRAEFSKPDPTRSQNIGHMLYLEDYEDASAWGRLYLERAFREDIRLDLLEKRDDWINRMDYDVLDAMFRTREIQVGSVGYSVPWVNGTAGNVDYVPPQWRNKLPFDNTHTHFLNTNAAATEANIITMLDLMAKHLSEHGHIGMKIAFLAENLGTLLVNGNNKRFANFIPANFRLLSGATDAPISTVTGQLEGVPGEVIGYFTSKNGMVEVRTHPRIPDGYLWMGFSYGNNDPANPLAVRLYPGKAFGLFVDPQVDRSINPKLDSLSFTATHGVNVNDRTAGVAAVIADGASAYEEPALA